MEHRFTLNAKWSGNLSGQGSLDSPRLSTPIAAPLEMSGTGQGATPEDLLLGAAAACYAISLGAVLSRRKIAYERLELESELFVSAQGLPAFKRIVHRPRVVGAEVPAEAFQRAEQVCLVSNAIRGNVEVTVIPQASAPGL